MFIFIYLLIYINIFFILISNYIQKRYFWNPTIDTKIKAAWKVKTTVRYKDIIADLKETRKRLIYMTKEA